MAHDPEVKRQAHANAAEGMSLRTNARSLGVSPATVKTWLAEKAPDVGPIGADEEAVTAQLLAKSGKLLTTIETLDPKDQASTATAVEKLLGKYLQLTGQASESHVVVEQSGSIDDLFKALKRAED